ncbi:hypothetical protein Sango_1041200 [Sesamum angolense]|uniref:Reverse transcriptase domain-containing protein n=1 Tax=Sesamum angolense TaxID=2727404 RepID=A0AAE1X0J1_9LAMI|nr:hypothetical protein Sango_1041200 [Sesamum angolense]
MKVYIDDILVKSMKEQDDIKGLEECFQVLKKFGMKLNPSKCTFGVRGAKFLGHMIFKRGIEANLEKITSIMDVSTPKSIKEVQKLVGRLATLNQFISRSVDKGLPFFKVLRGVAKFEWNKTNQETFDELQRYLVLPSLLTKSKTGEALYLYLAVSESVVSLVLSHQVIVLTNHSLKQVVSSPELFEKIVKWTIELSEFGIEFHPRPAIKAMRLNYRGTNSRNGAKDWGSNNFSPQSVTYKQTVELKSPIERSSSS